MRGETIAMTTDNSHGVREPNSFILGSLSNVNADRGAADHQLSDNLASVVGLASFKPETPKLVDLPVGRIEGVPRQGRVSSIRYSDRSHGDRKGNQRCVEFDWYQS